MRQSRLALPFSFPLIIDCNLLLRLKIYFIEEDIRGAGPNEPPRRLLMSRFAALKIPLLSIRNLQNAVPDSIV